MHIYRSNRLERLFEALSSVLASVPHAALEPQTIVVQSKGMERWLSLQLASQFGIWANPDFPFPRAFVERVFLATTSSPSDAELYSRDTLQWTLSDILPNLLGEPEFAPVRNYLCGDEDLKRFELCQRIAYAFDQYAVYRPELLLTWQRERSNDWQATLWQHVVKRHGPHHVAARAEEFLEAWPKLARTPEVLPATVCVFGISSLPPLYVRVLAALSERISVHFFSLSSTRDWPTDTGSSEPAPLASLGQLGRDFERILRDSGTSVDLFEEPGSGTMLRALQSDLLASRRRGRSGDRPPLVVSGEDESISIHSCHSPMREVEVLRDRLLDCFERDEKLEAHDVVVMMPSVETYAPLIDAVFGLDANDSGYIPYRIADRTLRTENALADALLQVLSVLSGRLKASEVLDLLTIEPIRLRFGISADALPDLQELVREAGIRWAIDGAHRETLGQPPQDGNTWRFGLRRLLLGYALEGRDRLLYAGTLPYDNVEGDLADCIGRLSEFVETLFAFREQLEAPRPPAAWADALSTLVDRCMATDVRTEWQRNLVHEVLAEIVQSANIAASTGSVSLAVMTSVLSQRLEGERTNHDFLSGGVTFCAMLPMRSIPFKIVCLLGLNDADFPRNERPASFDVITREPRLGDRSTREEDRCLFLEALLSARDRLLLSYVGRSAHDNTEYPPSIVVAELQATMDAAFVVGAGGGAQLALPFDLVESAGRASVVHHRLQAFSVRYFSNDGDRRLFSFSESNAAGARALCAPAHAPVRFQKAALEPEPVSTLTLDDLARFFRNPARALLQRQLGVYFEEEPQEPEDREPDDLDALGNYSVGAVLLEQALDGHDVRRALALIRARGVLPLGTPGQAAFGSVLTTVQAIRDAASEWIGSARLSALDVDLEINGTTLQGSLSDLYRVAQVRWQYGRIRPGTDLLFWVRHLALQCAAPPDYPRRSVLIGRTLDGKSRLSALTRVFEPMDPEAARVHLAELLSFYQLGQQAPLSFFPVTSRRFVDSLRRSAKDAAAVEKALSSARRAFSGKQAAEADDAYVQRLFTGVDPFVDHPVPFDEDGALGLPSFSKLACRIFGPLLDCSTTEER